MQGDVAVDYMRRVRELGFKIGLHTNGFYPNILRKAIDVIDWVGLDFKATRDKYPDLTGQHIAYDNMMRSLDILISHNKDFEVRVTCDPRFISKNDLIEIAEILAMRDVKNIAIQKYIPHFENDDNKTTDAMRNQFFTDSELISKINTMFKSVVWRN